MKKNKRIVVLLPILVLLVVGALVGNTINQETPYQNNKGTVFGTLYSITYQSDEDLRSCIDSALLCVDASLSMFNEKSVVSYINGNKEVELDEHFLNVYRLACDVNQESDGAFDITVAPLVNAWGFGFKTGSMPDKNTVDSLRKYIGMEKVTLKHGSIEKQFPQIMLDCGAIAKGYGVDVVARVLREHGVHNFMVEIGGEIVTSGVNPKRNPWRIGVVKPVDDSLDVVNELQTCINVTDMAMATSGNYRNFYYKGGKKYAHTIDPKTGYPVQHNILSATVLAKDCAVADAYATSFMVMGLDKARKVLDRHPELMAYLIYSDSNGCLCEWFSPSLKDKVAK